jgi:hypothetical protein
MTVFLAVKTLQRIAAQNVVCPGNLIPELFEPNRCLRFTLCP